jgi:hypothetical protein
VKKHRKEGGMEIIATTVVTILILGLVILLIGGVIYTTKAFSHIHNGEGGADYPEI